MGALVAAIDSERQQENLSSTIRLFVLEFYRKQLSEEEEGRITEDSTAPNWERAQDRSPPLALT